jgi:hypothetical protein
MPDPSTRDSIAAGMSCHDRNRVNPLVGTAPLSLRPCRPVLVIAFVDGVSKSR